MANGFRTIPSTVAQLAARRAVLGPTADPLEGLLQGFQQGQALQQLPETLQAQQEALALQQLERQLATANAQQRLRDLQDPNAALVRQVQQQLGARSADPTSGIVSVPEVLATETIGRPGALTPAQESALISGGDQPIVTPDFAIEPITVGGLPTGFALDLSRAASGTEALSRAKGTTSLERQLLANAQAEANRLSREQIAREANITRENIATTRTARGGLTENARLARNARIVSLGGDISDPELLNEQGQLDPDKLSILEGQLLKQEKAQERQDKQAKLEQAKKLPASIQEDIGKFLSARDQIQDIRRILLDPKNIGKEPGTIQNALARVASIPSTGFFSSLTRQAAVAGLTEESKNKEAIRSGLETGVSTALSGKALTNNERQLLSGMIPQVDDTTNDLLRKTSELDNFLFGRIEGQLEARDIAGGDISGIAPPISRNGITTPGINPQAPAPVQETTTRSGLKIRRISP